jgi:hypothetical protein
MRAPKEIIALVAPLAIISDVICGFEEEVGTEDVELKIKSIALELIDVDELVGRGESGLKI